MLVLKFSFPSTHLGWRNLVFVGNLLDALLFFQGFFRHADFELRAKVSSFSFHWSDFGVFCPSRPAQVFNKPLAPFPGATSNTGALPVRASPPSILSRPTFGRLGPLGPSSDPLE